MDAVGCLMGVPQPSYKDTVGGVMLQPFCNIFGDDINGAKRYMGGLGDASQVDKQWYCPSHSVGRWRMECEHGHKGQIMKLCSKHFNEFRASVTFCPACNTDENHGHKCHLTLVTVS